MKINISIVSLLFFTVSLFAQNLSGDYRVIPVNKKVADIEYANPYSSPLENYVARMHSWITGKYEPLNSEKIDYLIRLRSPQKPYSQQAAENMLNSEIVQTVIYKDSVSFVFRRENAGGSSYIVGLSAFENGKWLGTGEDICSGDVDKYIKNVSTKQLNRLSQYYRQKIVSTDTVAFVNYLKTSGKEPVSYLLDKLNNHPLVIYGEIHRRKVSWDFLKKVINTHGFTDICGTVFMELSHYSLPVFDKFLNNEKLDTALVLQILENELQYGWHDKGAYEFIREVWKVNQKSEKKLKIIPLDFQANWNEIKTREDWNDYVKNHQDRDSTMANIICDYLKTGQDNRNHLFIVGAAHAKKTSPEGTTGTISAGTLLSQWLPKEDVFSIHPHSMISDNHNFLGRVRYGLFDCVFERNGDKPVAFDLANSPFGKEPFDADQFTAYENYGNYEDLYDGYMFLCPIKDEPYDYELYTDKFVEELKRRARIIGNKNIYNIPVESVTKEKIIDGAVKSMLFK